MLSIDLHEHIQENSSFVKTIQCVIHLPREFDLLFIFTIFLSTNNQIPTCISERRNQEFYRAGEVSWNKGTSIIIPPTTHKKGPARKHLGVFSPIYF